MPPTPPLPARQSFAQWFSSAWNWLKLHPLEALLLGLILSCLIYFYGVFSPFIGGQFSTATWAWQAWNPLNSQEHSKLVLPISLFLVWLDRRRLQLAPKEPSSVGLLVLALGLGSFILGAWSLQPRLSILSLPLLLLGCSWFLWGPKVARILLFPSAFLLFMLPLGNFVQGTVSLQLLVTSVCNSLASLIGVQIAASGTTIRSLDGSFNFEIAEGCSGVRSLMAMATVSALYVHFAQPVLWKKVAVFIGSIVFSLIGNIGRIFTVLLVAKWVSPTLAGGLYHDYSSLIFFPIAISAMTGFNRLLKVDLSRIGKLAIPAEKPAKGSAANSSPYDY